MAKQEASKEQKQLACFAKALGHPVRIAILQMLSRQDCCYHGDMSKVLPVAKSTLSQHLNELKDAGLIPGTVTPPTVKYFINPDNWALARKMMGKLFSDTNEILYVAPVLGDVFMVNHTQQPSRLKIIQAGMFTATTAGDDAVRIITPVYD